MLGTILGTAAKSAARAAVAQKKARDEALLRAGYRCPSCGTDRLPEMLSADEKMTLRSWFFGGGLLGLWWRKLKSSALTCPNCRHRPDLRRYNLPS